MHYHLHEKTRGLARGRERVPRSGPDRRVEIARDTVYRNRIKQAKTLKLRIKDKHAKTLLAMGREVNLVWNYYNETSHRSIRERRQWLSGFDLQKLTNGLSKYESVRIGSPTVKHGLRGLRQSPKAVQAFKTQLAGFQQEQPQIQPCVDFVQGPRFAV